MINGRTYFKQVERKILEWYETLGPPVEEYLRYDDEARTVVTWDADEAGERLYFQYLCDLSAAFHSHPCADLVFEGLNVTGGAQQTEDGPDRFFKRFSYRTFDGYYEFEHGRGPVSWTPAGFFETREVYYTRIDSVEYGWSYMPPEASLPSEPKEIPPALEMHIFNVFPLPSSGRFTASYLPRAYGVLHAEVVDVRGRRIWETTMEADHLTEPARMNIDGSSWGSGVYFVRLTDESGSSAVRAVVITR